MHSPRKRQFLNAVIAAAALTGLCAAPIANAQQFPTRHVRIVVPYTPGGGIDVLARVLGAELQKIWNQPVVIDNKPGAGSHLGTDFVAKSAPDGGNWVIVSNTMALAAAAGTKLPYDPLKDLAPALLATSAPFVLAANAREATSVKDLIARARAKPGAFNFASAGQGTSTHLAIELLQARTGIKVLHVPYKGSGPALTDLIDGRVGAPFATPAAIMPHVRDKRLLALAVTGKSRTDSAPGVPTMVEEGMANFDMTVWFGLLAAAGTPPAILRKFHQDSVRALALPEVVTRLKGQGQDVAPLGPEEFGALLKSEVATWSEIIKNAGVQLN